LSRRSSVGFEASITSIYLSDLCGRTLERSLRRCVPLLTATRQTSSHLGELRIAATGIEVTTSLTPLKRLAFLNSNFSIHHPPCPLGEWLKATLLAALACIQHLKTGRLNNRMSNCQHQNLDTPETKHLKSR
jgi:hypothetical protein